MPPCPTIHDVEPRLMIEPPPAAAIPGHDGLGREELVAQVHREAIVPVLRRHRLDRVPLVVGRVVDQHADRPEPRLRLGDRRAERRDVSQVAGDEHRRGEAARRSVSTSAVEASRWMSTNATRARWAQRCSTMDAPMPLPPPVTKTTRSSRLGYVAERIMGASRAHASTRDAPAC